MQDAVPESPVNLVGNAGGYCAAKGPSYFATFVIVACQDSNTRLSERNITPLASQMQGSTSYAYSSSAVEPAYINTESSKNTRIADEKRARKAVEEDAARLQNRVQTLQKEEQKAQKRLEETRLKAQDLLALRAQNEQKQLEREERYRQQQVRRRAII